MHKVKVSWDQWVGGGWQRRSREFWGLWAIVDARAFCNDELLTADVWVINIQMEFTGLADGHRAIMGGA